MAQNQAVTTFAVWAPYSTAEGIAEVRLQVRPRHLENAQRLTKEGVIRAGGPLLAADSANAAPPDRKFFGSCLIMEAGNLDAVRELIENDVYYTAGVWDKEKLQILPMILANPLPPVSLS